MFWQDDATSGHALGQQHALWPLLSGDGSGLFLRHWTTLTWEPHDTSPENEFISLTEPHKTHQCQVGIRRKLPVPGAPKPPYFPNVGQAEVSALVRAIVRFVRPLHTVYGIDNPQWLIKLLEAAVDQNRKDWEWERDTLFRPPMSSSGGIGGRGDIWHNFHRLSREYYIQPHQPTLQPIKPIKPIKPRIHKDKEDPVKAAEFGAISSLGKSISDIGEELASLWSNLATPGTIVLHSPCPTESRKDSCKGSKEDKKCSNPDEALPASSCRHGSVAQWVKVTQYT